jgi:integrase
VARKNGNGEGSRPRERADGRWEARYWRDGKRRSVYGNTSKEAAEKLAKAMTDSKGPTPALPATDITFGEILKQYDDAVRDTMKRRSLETHRDIGRLHLLPAFERTKLVDLMREGVQGLYARRRDAGLSPARVRRIHGVLSAVLNTAVRWRHLERNVCRDVNPPRVPTPAIRALSRAEAQRFLEAAESDRFYALYVLGMTTGARLGELGGLFYSDVDLSRRVVRIQRALVTGRGGQTLESPKTANSRRSIGLSIGTVAALEHHIERQQAEGFGVEGDALVFTNAVGGPINPPHLFCRSFKLLFKRAGLPRTTLHAATRHTFCCLALQQGVNVRTG